MELQDLEVLKSCPVCSSNEIAQRYITHDRHYGIKGDYRIDECKACKLLFLNPMPSQDYLTSLYPKTYYSYQDFFKRPSFIKRMIQSTLVRVRTKDPSFSEKGRMLDIGCGSGKFIYEMRKDGWEVHGVEVNVAAAQLGKEAGKLEIYPGDLSSAAYPSGYFDYVRSNHSFEHIVNNHEVVAEIYRILKPGGKLLIGVPNIDSLNARLFKKYWWYLGAPVHTFNYSPVNLKMILTQHGFNIEKVHYNSDYSGILGSLQIYFNRKNGKPSTEGLLYPNPLLRIIFHQVSKLIDVFKKGDVIEVICSK